MNKLHYIQYLCEQALIVKGLQEDQKYIQRLERELTNIDVQSLQDYVLNLLEKNAKIDEHNSLVYYLLGLTNKDPIDKELEVKKQASFPDIDSDFSVNEREDVIKYFMNKYGHDHVAPIGSYGQMKIKSVIRDIARIYDIDLSDTNAVAKNLGDDVDNMDEEEFDILLSKEPTDEGYRKDFHDLKLYLEKYPAIREIIFLLKGQLRHLTKHPAGVVATPTKIQETIPLMKHKNAFITSWVDGIFRKDLQLSGFIKFDILGLKTLTIVKEILELIRERKQYNDETDLDIEELDTGQMISLLYEEFSTLLPLDGNDEVYEKFRNTDTNGIFQFECLSGDTWVGNSRLREIYKRFYEDENSIHKIGSVNITKRKKVRQRIVAMKKQCKKVYRVVINNFQCIESTKLHQFYTPSGWKELKDISVGDKVLIDQERSRVQYVCETCDNVIEHTGICDACLKAGRKPQARSILNKFKNYRSRYKFKEIIKIVPMVETDVYDLAVENKPHNYVANGFVVHNSALMKSLLKEIKPTCFDDITSATALGRPGPLDMGMHHEYAERKNGKSFNFGNPLIEECLKNSYGILVYQEDVMRLCNMVAGFPLDLTDTVRKNLMKSVRDGDARDKNAKQREQIMNQFIDGCAANGLSKKVAEEWWKLCVSFARYGFNKSHAVAYTILSYHMMWFKVYYPLEFYVVLFSNSPKDKFSTYFAEAMNKGVKIIPVDIMKAKKSFTIHGEDIMFGINHIMGVGPAIVETIVNAQPFDSFDEFYEKTSEIKKISKTAMMALINGHAFDCFGTQNEIIEKYFKEIRKDKKWVMDVDYTDKKFEHDMFVKAYSLDWRAKLTDDKKELIKKFGAKSLAKLVAPKPHLRSFVWGMISDIISKTSANGNDYYYLILTDSKFNIARVRLPLWNRKCKKAKLLNNEDGSYSTVKIKDILEIGNIIVGQVESSTFHDKVFVDMIDICCLGNVYEKTAAQRDRINEVEKIYNNDDGE